MNNLSDNTYIFHLIEKNSDQIGRLTELVIKLTSEHIYIQNDIKRLIELTADHQDKLIATESKSKVKSSFFDFILKNYMPIVFCIGFMIDTFIYLKTLKGH